MHLLCRKVHRKIKVKIAHFGQILGGTFLSGFLAHLLGKSVCVLSSYVSCDYGTHSASNWLGVRMLATGTTLSL